MAAIKYLIEVIDTIENLIVAMVAIENYIVIMVMAATENFIIGMAITGNFNFAINYTESSIVEMATTTLIIFFCLKFFYSFKSFFLCF